MQTRPSQPKKVVGGMASLLEVAVELDDAKVLPLKKWTEVQCDERDEFESF